MWPRCRAGFSPGCGPNDTPLSGRQSATWVRCFTIVAPRGSGSEFFRALGYGFVAIVAAPLFLIVLAFTVVGIPMTIMGFGLFGMGAYFAKILVGGMIGMAIFGEPEEADWGGFGVPLAAGLGIVVVSMAIPFLGGIVGFVTLLTGLGMLIGRLRLRFWDA